MRRRVHILVSGRVQGVSYRASAYEKAVSLGVSGWVRNLSDGRVEILAEGAASSIAAFVEWCGRGPRWARVDRVNVTEETPAGNFSSFAVRRDG